MEANDGGQALSAIRARRPDLIIMDVEMPGLGGVEVCRIVKANQGESGSVIIMDPHTGGIIAWADYPTYNANSYASSNPATIKDRVAADLYEPGSVMKVVTLAGALDAHAIMPTATIQDPGYVDVGGFRIRDWDLKNHGTVTYTRVLEESYNVGAVKAEQAEGGTNYYRYLQSFGFNAASNCQPR